MPNSSNSPDTLGIEFEATVSSVEEMQKLVSNDETLKAVVRSIVRDASIESTTVAMSNTTRLFLGDSRLRSYCLDKYPSRTAGYELVTVPLSLNDACLATRKILALQSMLGEVFSPRASIHIHTGFPLGITFLKSALAVGLFAEPLLYKIAGMGRRYRGEVNRSAYARPFAKPPAVPLDDGTYAVLNPANALKAGDINEFWANFGITPGERGRYTPLRYFGVNLFSILLRGTLEFRHFNMSTSSKDVEAVLALCQILARLAEKVPYIAFTGLPVADLDEHNSDDIYYEIVRRLLDISKKYDCGVLCRTDAYALDKLISSTPQAHFDPGVTRTHLRDYSLSRSMARQFGLRIIPESIDPGIVDIHTFVQKNHKLEEE